PCSLHVCTPRRLFPCPTPFPYTTLVRSERRQGRGTFAAGNAPLSAPQQSSDIDALMAHLARMGMQTQVRLLELETVAAPPQVARSEEHTSELQSRENLVCRLLREQKKLN